MVFDVHSHAHTKESFTAEFEKQAIRMRGYYIDQTSRLEDYRAACRLGGDVKTVVFGGKARLSGIWTPDRHVAEYCAQDPAHLIPFMSLDPTQPGWRDEMSEGHRDLGMRGIKLLPMYAGFYPHSPELDDLWSYASRNGLPVLLHTGTTFVDQAPLDCTLPRHLDAVAIRYPECRIILAHLGHPYEGETVAVIRKHPNVYADISALFYRPFQLYHSLMLVQEYGVWNKLLFGTDFPVTTVDDTICGVRSLNRMVEGTALPRLSESEIENLIARDAGPLLGL
jgi:predicted TIM-barrel fold metal-dependent hydrolase